jgi:hypothetical protein
MAIEEDSRGEYKNLVSKIENPEKYMMTSELKVKKGKKEKEILKGKKWLGKPKVHIQKVDVKKVISSMPYNPMVKEGRTGYFNDEYEREIKWLGR